MRLTWFIAAVTSCVVATAHADGKLYPLSGSNLSRELRGAPAELTQVLARAYDAEIAGGSIEEAAQLLECDLPAKPCLEEIAKQVKGGKIIFGSVTPINGGVALRVTSYDAQQGAKVRAFTLEGDSVEALAQTLEEELAAKARKAGKPPKGKDPDEPPTEEPPIEEPPAEEPAPKDTDPDVPLDTELPAGKISTSSWALMIGGGVGVAIGGGLLLSASSLRGELNRQPTETRADIDRLLAIERAGKLRTQIGGALMVAGGVALTVGVVRAVIQRRQPATEEKMIDVVPERGGASVLFTVRWP